MPLAPINGQEIYYQDSQGDGPAVIFMHGFLMDQSLFDKQVEVLSPQYRCIRWDARGFGNTKWDGKPFNLYDSVKDCFGLIDHLKVDSGVLVGMSQGGYCAMRAALTNPKRVKALVLMSTQSTVDPEPLKDIFRNVRDTWRLVGSVQPLLEGLAATIIGPIENPGMEKHWNQWLPKWKEISGTTIFHAMNNLLDRDEISHRLHEIACPVLVTHGNDDSAIPVAVGEELSKKFSNCQGFVTSPGCHAVNMTHSEIINPPLKKFLDDQQEVS
jgi:3-oxoadipate enol-lactonase